MPLFAGFNDHRRLAGQHSFLSASKPHWINYEDDKMLTVYGTAVQAAIGTRLHDYAAMAIRLRQRQPSNNKTVNAYINDAISFRMTPEQTLFFSEFAFGTADAISFRKEHKDDDELTLRIHDLKTGVTPTSFRQLYIYAAYFCLEYKVKPGEIKMEFRIYQNDDCKIEDPDIDEVIRIMGKIVRFDKLIRKLRKDNDLD